VNTLNVYSYYNAAGTRKYADFNDVIFTGTWSSTGSYYASAMQVVDFSQGQYIAITDNVNKIPTTQPTKWAPTRYWSSFVIVSSGGTTPTDPTYQIALSGSNLAVQAYGTAIQAYYVAQQAINIAVNALDISNYASDVAEAAFSIAVTGTNLATQALSVAQSGTAAANQALTEIVTVLGVASTGTNVGYQAQAVANEALQIAITGTNVGYQSQAVANLALQIAIIGTQIGSLAFAAAGTAQTTANSAYSLAQDAYDLASAGTTAGAAYSLAQSAYDIAVAGTNLGTQAYNLAQDAYDLAWDTYTGTVFIRNENAQVFCNHISWGTGTNNVNAAQMPYSSTQTVAQVLDLLLYVPLQLSSFTNNVNTLEQGSSTSNVVLNWAYNKAVTSQSINQGIGSLPIAQRTVTDTGTFSTTRTYSLSATDGTTSDGGNTSVTFMQKRYWGVSVNTSLNDAQIIALSSEFSSSKSQSRIITAASEYIYFAYPASFGTASFTVNGLPNTAWTLVTRAFVNASGYSESYNIYRSDNLLTGTYTIIVS